VAAPSLLAVRGLFNTPIQVVRITSGTTATAIGGTLPGASLEAHSNDTQYSVNRVVQFYGRLYCLLGNVIYSYDAFDDVWTLRYTLPGVGATSSITIGLYVGHDSNGLARLCAIYQTSANFSISYSPSGHIGSWTTFNLVGESPVGITYGRGIVFRNQVVAIVGDGVNLRMIDMERLILTQINNYISPIPFGSGQSIDFCVFQNNLYSVIPNMNSPYDIQIYRYDAGTFVLVQTLTLLQAPQITQGERGACALFQDGTYMYALVPAQNGSNLRHWHLIQLTPSGGSFTETDRTTNLPADWKNGASSKTFDTAQVQVYVDNETSPSAPSIQIYLKDDDASTGVGFYYEWPGVGVNWPAAAASVLPDYYLGNPKMGGGERFWDPGDLDAVQAFKPIPTFEGMRVSFTVAGDPLTFQHNGISGTLKAGDFVTGANSGATGYILDIGTGNPDFVSIGGIVGSFFGNETISETLGVNFCIINVGPTGGAADKVVKVYLSTEEETPVLQATLKGTATGGTALRSGNTVTQIIADAITVYTVEIDLNAMGLLSVFKFVHLEYEVQ